MTLIDFGYATDSPEKATGLLGTRSYIAPEMRKQERYDARKSDVFSLGVTLYAAVYGFFPFEDSSDGDPVFKQILDGEEKEFWTRAPDSSPELRDLLWRMFSPSPKDRPSVEEVLSHKWTQS